MKNQKGFWFQNLKMKITQNMEPEVEMTLGIAYSVSALMKLNIISAVIPTDNANLLPMHKNKVLATATVVTGGFGRRASVSSTQRTWMQAARSVCVAALSILIALLFGPLYG